MYKELYSVGAKPTIRYGLPKIHKQNIPLCLIISSIGTFSYKAAKYLSKLLSLVAVNNYLLHERLTISVAASIILISLGHIC